MILSRDFQYKFGSTEFNWETSKVRLGRNWLQPKMWVRGGQFNDRVAVANGERDVLNHQFDINPNLEPTQKKKLESFRTEYKDRFAPNPKKPTLTSVGEHRIDTVPDARPVKTKRFRMSPQRENEANRQAEEMMENGVARPSASLAMGKQHDPYKKEGWYHEIRDRLPKAQ